MARVGLALLLMMMVGGLLAAIDAAEEETEFPSLMSVMGSQLALADDYYDEDEEGAAEEETASKPCCFPTTWQGRLESRFGFHSSFRSGHSHAVDQLYVDGKNKRIAGSKVECHGRGKGPVKYSYTLKVASNRSADLYLFDPTLKKCAHRTLRNVVWRQQCIPGNATLEASYSVGPVGRLNIQSWVFGGRSRQSPAIDGDSRPTPRPRVEFGASVAVVPGTCVPVVIQEHGFVSRRRGIEEEPNESESQSDESSSADGDEISEWMDNYFRRMTTTARPHPHPGPHPGPRPRPRPRPGSGVGFGGSIIFGNVQTSIRDPSVFNVPSYCKKNDNSLYYGDEQLTDDQEMPTILERFIVL